MSVVAITGVAGYLGHHLLARLEADPGVTRIIGLDIDELARGTPKLDFHRFDARNPAVAKALVGSDVVVHLAFRHDPLGDRDEMRSINVEGTHNVLEAAATIGAHKIVYLSSATVYGAHADNPVPLTEDAPLRANVDFPFAADKLEAERALEAFRPSHPGVVVTVLRSATIFGTTVENFVTRMLEAPRLTTVRGHEPPMQFVHEEDAAEALALAVREDLDGIYNLAADDWLSAAELEEISGKKRVELPESVAFSMAERLWRAGLTAAPPGELHYVMHPWVADNAKLRAAGWRPRYTNRAALLETLETHRNWITLGRARMRKDSLAKGAAATLGAIGAMALVRRARRRA